MRVHCHEYAVFRKRCMARQPTRFRDMFKSTPTAPISTAMDVPPALKKGRGWPVVGIMPVTTATFITVCTPTMQVTPPASRLPKRSGQRKRPGSRLRGSLTDPTTSLDIIHMSNFVACIRSGSQKTAAPADEGYMSSYMPIVANISLDLHEPIRTDPETGRPIGNKAAEALWRREYEKGWNVFQV